MGRDRRTVTVRELKGAQRAQVWRDVVIARAPAFARYPEKAGRDVSSALLTPRS